MSKEITNNPEMPEQLSDILLVLDKEKMKIQAIKSMDENGKMETVEPTKKNQNQFMRVDKSGDFFSNFFSFFCFFFFAVLFLSIFCCLQNFINCYFNPNFLSINFQKKVTNLKRRIERGKKEDEREGEKERDDVTVSFVRNRNILLSSLKRKFFI